RRDRSAKNTKLGGKAAEEAKAELAVLERVITGLNEGLTVRRQRLKEEELELLRDLFLLTGKPVLYVANISESQIGKEDSDPAVKAVRAMAAEEGAEVVVLAAALESEIQQLPEEERAGF